MWRRRIYVICPDLQSAQQTMNDLLLARIDERHIHVLARRGAPMEGLHEASVLQKTDLVHGAGLGLLVGGAAGVLLGVFVVLQPPDGVTLQLITILLTALGGAFFGTWVSSMVAAGVPNTKLLAFAKDIDEEREPGHHPVDLLRGLLPGLLRGRANRLVLHGEHLIR